jgi:hypothetical protein
VKASDTGGLADLGLGTQKRSQTIAWGKDAGRSYLVPALEIPAYLFLLNQFDRHAFPHEMAGGKPAYAVDFSNFKDHLLHGRWEVDKDAFAMNQFNHPYGGTIYHGFARSAGLNFWEALAYDNAGSLLWELGGENTNPSINDQINTGIGGSFFGEALFRMANLMFEGDGDDPGFLRRLGATMLSPTTAFNRSAFGDRFKGVFSSHDPALFTRLELGATLHSNLHDQGVDSTDSTQRGMLNFHMAYGLPGKAGYTYTRPFDYFQFEFDGLTNTGNPVDNIMVRGLLVGTDYEAGDTLEGIWGLYGGYDYISPTIFRISSTSVSVGTTVQARPTGSLTVQGTLLGGVGYAAVGNVTRQEQRDYHYGVASQGLLAFRLIFGDRAMLDVTGRRYYVTGSGGGDPQGREAIDRLSAGFTFRLFRTQGLGIQYLASSRSAHYPDQPDSRQTVGTVAVVYTLLGDTGFGAVK